MKITEINPTSLADLQLKRVAAYARVSTDKDAAEHSLVQQISYYNEFISSYPGWTFAGVYADDGVSGTLAERPEFQRLMADCRAGKIDLVITKSVTRFARNLVTFLEAVRELKSLGIDVLFEKENLHSLSKDGEFILSMLAIYAEEEARTASENKKWQIRRDFENGRPTYARPYGYQWVDGHFEIVPDEAEVVKRIFNMYLSGDGPYKIAKTLNAEGISIWGKKWYHPSIFRILKNEKYKGDMLLQKRYRPDFRCKKDVANNGAVRQYYVSGSHEPIIPPEMFDRVQAEIAKRKQIEKPKDDDRPPEEKYLFHNLIVCQHCKGHYIHRMNPTSTGKYPIWKCQNVVHRGYEFCPARQIRESVLIKETKKVLGLSDDTELTREIILKSITAIESAADNQLRFFLADGTVKTVHWENRSRSESWTPEMKQAARDRAIERQKARKEAQNG